MTSRFQAELSVMFLPRSQGHRLTMMLSYVPRKERGAHSLVLHRQENGPRHILDEQKQTLRLRE